ncbi:hypothetical protein SB816_32480, partial [Achromobacter sp. SIMBA_011]|uniref:hypothetical protein n=1 Tax=Achromobacter sp. SIMBA_011 TaxID=3085759 RepID=UPI00397DAC5B
ISGFWLCAALGAGIIALNLLLAREKIRSLMRSSLNQGWGAGTAGGGGLSNRFNQRQGARGIGGTDQRLDFPPGHLDKVLLLQAQGFAR